MQNTIKSEDSFESRTKTILLVEDEVITAMAQAQLLANSGYKVIQAVDGDTAVSIALENGDVDLVLMDIDLGSGINGTRAAELILSGRDIPIVFLTSHAEKEMVQMVKDITRYGYVIKNSGEFVLLSSLEMAFELFQAHRETREREEYLDVTLQSIADCVISTDIDGRIVRMNRAAENITGWTLKEASGKNLYDIFHVTDLGGSGTGEHRQSNVLTIVRKGEWRHKLMLVSRNGDIYRIDKSSAPIRDSYGNIMGRVIIFRDVTGEHETQKALMERGALMHGLFENMPSCAVIYRINNDGSKASDYIITDVNSAAERFQQRGRGEMIGRSLDDVRPDIEKLNVLPFYRRVWETGITEYFPARAYKNNRIIYWFDNYAFKLPTGEIVTIYSDVSEQKRTGEALRESEEKLHLIMDGIPAYVAYVDNNENYVYVNKAYADWHGKSKDDFPGRSLREIVDRSYYLKAEPYYSRVFSGERVVYENTLLDRNGEERIVKVEYVPHMSNGVVSGFFALLIDITEEKRSGERVLGLLREKEILLKEVHHRIKNNMGSIASLLYLQSDTLVDSSAIEAIKDARNRVISMMGIYEMLYRSEDCRNVSVFDYLYDLIEKVSSTFIRDGRITIEKEIEDFKLDSSKLFPAGMIINELLTNALKYAFTGGRSGSILIKMKRLSARTVELTVRDSGVGLPEDVKMGRAKGFGISLVNMLVQQLNGKLTIGKSQGTEFRVSFMI